MSIMNLHEKIKPLLRSDGKLNNWYTRKMTPELENEIVLAVPKCEGSLPEKIYWVMSGRNDYPVCECGKRIMTYRANLQDYAAFCSKECMKRFNGSRISKAHQSRTDEQWASSTSAAKATRYEKYGTFNSPKWHASILETYGVTNISQIHSVKEKKKATMLKNHGAEHWFQTEAGKAYVQEHNRTMNRNQTPQQLEKWFKSCKNRKGYTLPSGKVILVQGYENLALDLLLQLYNENEIVSGVTEVPIIRYEINGRSHRYFPDFFIPSENLIVEVKSTYTYMLHRETVLLKMNETLNNGFRFMFLIFDGHGNIYAPDAL